jgi:hypothetical protein
VHSPPAVWRSVPVLVVHCPTAVRRSVPVLDVHCPTTVRRSVPVLDVHCPTAYGVQSQSLMCTALHTPCVLHTPASCFSGPNISRPDIRLTLEMSADAGRSGLFRLPATSMMHKAIVELLRSKPCLKICLRQTHITRGSGFTAQVARLSASTLAKQEVADRTEATAGVTIQSVKFGQFAVVTWCAWPVTGQVPRAFLGAELLRGVCYAAGIGVGVLFRAC